MTVWQKLQEGERRRQENYLKNNLKRGTVTTCQYMLLLQPHYFALVTQNANLLLCLVRYFSQGTGIQNGTTLD